MPRKDTVRQKNGKIRQKTTKEGLRDLKKASNASMNRASKNVAKAMSKLFR